jgi:L-ribulose-5-phosphate 4-epimerase
MSSLNELKEYAWKCNLDLPKHNLTIFTFGNASAFDRDAGVFAIKPSGVAYNELTPEMMVLVDLEGKTVDSKYRPSSDTKTHLILYKGMQKIGGVVHTHSTYSTSWAQACKGVPCLGTTHADYAPCEIPCTDEISDLQIDGDYETETGIQILNKISGHPYKNLEMILVANHGPFTWGEDAEKAVHNSVVLEELSKMAYITLCIDSNVKLMKQTLINKHFYRKNGLNAYYGQQCNC